MHPKARANTSASDTLTSDGTYTIQPVKAAAGTNLYYETEPGGSGEIFALHVYTGCDAVRWKIQKANGSPAGSASMNIILAHAVVSGPVRAMLWNRGIEKGPLFRCVSRADKLWGQVSRKRRFGMLSRRLPPA
jgi:hypothetical protein